MKDKNGGVLGNESAVGVLLVQSPESRNDFNPLRIIVVLESQPSSNRGMPPDEAEFLACCRRGRFFVVKLDRVVRGPNVVEIGRTKKRPEYKQRVLERLATVVDSEPVYGGKSWPVEGDSEATPSTCVESPKWMDVVAGMERVLMSLHSSAVTVDAANRIGMLCLHEGQARVDRKHLEQEPEPNIALDWRCWSTSLANEPHIFCNVRLLSPSR